MFCVDRIFVVCSLDKITNCIVVSRQECFFCLCHSGRYATLRLDHISDDRYCLHTFANGKQHLLYAQYFPLFDFTPRFVCREHPFRLLSSTVFVHRQPLSVVLHMHKHSTSRTKWICSVSSQHPEQQPNENNHRRKFRVAVVWNLRKTVQAESWSVLCFDSLFPFRLLRRFVSTRSFFSAP